MIPFLQEYKNNSSLGYMISVNWLSDILSQVNKLELRVVVTTFADDTVWILYNKQQMETTTQIATEFYKLNNI